jgi:hypothetical protein
MPWVLAGLVVAGLAVAAGPKIREGIDNFRRDKLGLYESTPRPGGNLSEKVPAEVLARLPSVLEKLNSTLEEIKVELIGGGARGNSAMSAYEREWAAYHLMRTAQTGVG